MGYNKGMAEVGRPRSYTDEQIEEIKPNLLKGLVDTEAKPEDIFSREHRFENEFAMVDYIEDNKEDFARLLNPNGKIISFVRELPLTPRNRMNISNVPNLRLDIGIEILENGKSKWWCIEVKNPTHARTELRSGVAQCMEYKTIISKDSEIVLVSSVYSDIVPKLINEFRLPLNYCFLNMEYFGMSIYKDVWSMP